MDTQVFWEKAMDKYDQEDQTWGQAIWNTLVEAGFNLSTLDGGLDDPQLRIKTRASASKWFNKFVVVVDGETIVGVRGDPRWI